MRTFLPLLVFISALLGTTAPAIAGQPQAAPSPPSASPAPNSAGVAAVVNGEAISLIELTDQCLQAAGAKALRQRIDETVIDQAATANGVSVTSDELTAKERSLAHSLGVSSLDAALQQHQMSRTLFDSGVRHQLELEALVTPRPRPARSMRHVWHIAVGMIYSDPAGNRLKKRSPAEALAIIRRIREHLARGARFQDLAVRYADPVSKAQRGDLGILCAGEPENAQIFAVARGLRCGEVSQHDFQSMAGYELVTVSSTAERHPKSEDAAYARAAAGDRQEQLNAAAPLLLNALRAKATIVIYQGRTDGPPGIAAAVNGTPIRRDEIAARALQTAGSALLAHMIADRLIDQAAAREGIVVTEADLDAKKAELLTRTGGQSLQDGLAKEHMTLAQLNDELTGMVKLERLTHRSARPATHMRNVYHIAIAAQDAGENNALPGPPGGSRLPTRDEALAKLQTIRERLNAGARFRDLARQYSDDLFSKNSGGALGILHDGTQVNKDILAVALTMKKGEVSQMPFKSFFGYELVYVESTQDDHPAAEDAWYADADREYRDSQTDAPIQTVMQSLEKSAKVAIHFQP